MGRPLFWFPYNVNEWNARITGGWVLTFCVFIIVFRDNVVMHWATLAFVSPKTSSALVVFSKFLFRFTVDFALRYLISVQVVLSTCVDHSVAGECLF